MRPTRPPLQSRIKNERIAVVSAVLSGFLTGEVYVQRAHLQDEREQQQEQEQEEEEED